MITPDLADLVRRALSAGITTVVVAAGQLAGLAPAAPPAVATPAPVAEPADPGTGVPFPLPAPLPPLDPPRAPAAGGPVPGDPLSGRSGASGRDLDAPPAPPARGPVPAPAPRPAPEPPPAPAPDRRPPAPDRPPRHAPAPAPAPGPRPAPQQPVPAPHPAPQPVPAPDQPPRQVPAPGPAPGPQLAPQQPAPAPHPLLAPRPAPPPPSAPGPAGGALPDNRPGPGPAQGTPRRSAADAPEQRPAPALAPGADADRSAAPFPGSVPSSRPGGAPAVPDDTAPGSAGPVGPPTPTAAERFGWGTPIRSEEFTGPLHGWQLYTGTGHAGVGRRSPQAVTVANGVATVLGDAAGTTGGMAWGGGRRYGRWEVRMRASVADPSYDAVLLLWPDDDVWPSSGEIDFAEMQDPARRVTGFYLHHGPRNEQLSAQVEVDATQWHTWGVEWTPQSVTGFVDGRPWFHTTDVGALPPGPMHLCVQLDWFPSGRGPVRPSALQVDWVREYR